MNGITQHKYLHPTNDTGILHYFVAFLSHCELKFYWNLCTEVTSPAEDVRESSLVFQSQQLLLTVNG